MYCEECGKQIADDSKFCDGCGAPVHPVKAPEDSYVNPYGYQNQMYGQNQEFGQGKPYGAPVPGGIIPEKKKKSTGTTALIVVLAVVAVALAGVLIFLGVKVFGGRKDPNAGMAEGRQATESSLEEVEKESTEAAVKEEESSKMSIAPSTTAAGIPTTAPTEAPTVPSSAVLEGEYILPNSNSAYLTEADLAGLTKEQLRLARNEIYARHGRKFKDDELNQYFLSKSWYTPLYEPNQFNESVFNDYENANRQLITEYEKKMGY